MEKLLQLAALILGIGISIHTVYMIIRAQIARNRERKAVGTELRVQYEMIISLANILSGKARSFQKKYHKPELMGLDLESTQAQNELKYIVAQTQQILDYHPKPDWPRISKLLNKSQMAALIDFSKNYEFYYRRLRKRYDELQALPNQSDVVGRFLSCTSVGRTADSKELIESFNELMRLVDKPRT